MNVENLREPKECTINGKSFILHKVTATVGRRIMIQYVESNVPKLGDYATSEKIMFELMKFVSVKLDNGAEIALDIPDLIDNHVGDAETLIELEKAMLEYNFSFFANGELSAWGHRVMKVAEDAIVRILTHSLAQSSPAEKQPSEN